MELVISDASFFKKCIDAIVNLVDEGTFIVSSDGLHLRTMDPSQIAMVDFHMPKSSFSKMDVEDKTSVGVNLADLSKILARTRQDEKLSISLDEKESKLFLEFSGHSRRHFKLPLLESSTTLPKEPKVEFDASIKIKGRVFKDALHDAGLLSSHVVLQADDSEFVIEAHGDSGDLHIQTKKDSEHITGMSVKGKSRAMFPFQYLEDITRACPDETIISVELKNDAPVKVSYDIGDAKIAYYLAPRVENV
ncbi:TPA: proliferating cell nuclear antigen (pcna) [Candidatus Micrarchaeota archaeon]|nr:proliferating cell nuclear antigen (pcna) [Candidatus Micrarchaeota archaeon]